MVWNSGKWVGMVMNGGEWVGMVGNSGEWKTFLVSIKIIRSLQNLSRTAGHFIGHDGPH